ncbi:hypothetical protein [Ancylobacter moscoviensis]
MAKLHASRRLSSMTLPVLAGLAAMTAVPAQAQFYYRPFGGVYVERYYEPLPPGGYYEPPPPVYRAPPPAYGAPGRFPFADVEPMLRSMGMRAVGRPRIDGGTYVVDATDPNGARVRVRIDAFNGRIIAMHPLGPARPAARQTAPSTAMLPPAVAPLPPRREPESGMVAAPPPAGAPAAEASPQEGAEGSGPAPADAPSAASVPPSTADAAPTASQAPTGEGSSVRVIPGVAMPPGTEPTTAAAAETPQGEAAKGAEASKPAGDAPAAAASGTGTGTGTGSDTPAGTASVMARGADGEPEPEE